MWDLPRPGIDPVSPALVGGFFTTEPPGKLRHGFVLTPWHKHLLQNQPGLKPQCGVTWEAAWRTAWRTSQLYWLGWEEAGQLSLKSNLLDLSLVLPLCPGSSKQFEPFHPGAPSLSHWGAAVSGDLAVSWSSPDPHPDPHHLLQPERAGHSHIENPLCCLLTCGNCCCRDLQTR